MRTVRPTSNTFCAEWQTPGFQRTNAFVGPADVSKHSVKAQKLCGCTWQLSKLTRQNTLNAPWHGSGTGKSKIGSMKNLTRYTTLAVMMSDSAARVVS